TGYFHLNAFIDLLTYASLIFFLENENKKMRFLALIPIAWMAFSYSYGAFFPNAFGDYSYLLNGLTNDYNIYGLCLFLAFYLVKKHFAKTYQGDELRNKSLPYQLLFGAVVIIFFTALFIGLSYAFYPGFLNQYGGDKVMAKWMASYKARDYTASWMFNILYFPACLEGSFWGILSFPLLFFYNGQLGYHKKWFRKFEYFFYPGHILICYITVILLAVLLG
ncbi:MAG: hypothetical protein K6F07_03410, partial [Bacilli bacterium]|nr:hypothetical protein [Bacilli bacterium]